MAKKKIMRQGTAPGAEPPRRPTGILIAQQTYSNIGSFLRVP